MGKTRRKSVKSEDEQEEGTSGQYWATGVLDWRVDESGVMLYLLRWYGYTDDQNTWEVQEHLSGCDQLLVDFHLNQVNGRHPPKGSFEEFKKLLKYLSQLFDDNDLAVLKRFAKKPIDCFKIRDNVVLKEIWKAMRTQIDILYEREKCLKNRSKTELRKCQNAVAIVATNLNINANFESVPHFFDFVDKRRVFTKELENWENTQNQVIVSESDGRPIRVVNDVDLEMPGLKGYITEYILDVQFGQNIRFEKEEPLVGCECTDCYDSRDECCTAVVGYPMVYTNKGVLNKAYNTLIYECNDKCKCSDSCPNRQVQRGR
ncbi:unnamed protein product, partial [Oppiella nova]